MHGSRVVQKGKSPECPAHLRRMICGFALKMSLELKRTHYSCFISDIESYARSSNCAQACHLDAKGGNSNFHRNLSVKDWLARCRFRTASIPPFDDPYVL